MIRKYLDAALARARYTRLEDGSYAAEVRGLRGVIATGRTIEKCRAALVEVVEGWVLVRVARGQRVPALGGATIRVRKVSMSAD
jgi:predicted RNase H-like HicB family nuclease